MSKSYPLATIPHHAGIYALTCQSTKKLYIGQTVNLNRRYTEWKGAISGGFRVSNSNIASMLKECPDWHMTILQEMPGATKEELDRAENYAIKKVAEKNPELLLNHMVQGPAAVAHLPSYLEGNHTGSNVKIEAEDGRLVSKKYAAHVLGVRPDTLKKRLQVLHRRNGITHVKLEDLQKK